MKFVVLGGGAQGSAAAFELLRRAEVEKVVIGDLDLAQPRPFLEPHIGDRLELRRVDATDHGSVREAIEGMDSVICALPYYFDFDVSRLAVECGAHHCDLGGNTEIVEQQRTLHPEAESKGVSVIPDCGLAPGMVNILAQAGIDALDETRSVKIRVGGLPQDPKPPLNYQIVYSMEGVLDYYTTLCIALEDGRIVHKEALTGVEDVEFDDPVGTLEAFHTAGGISTMPYRYQGRIPHMEYKTLRYPGHAAIMKAIRDLGLIDKHPVDFKGGAISPREFFIDLVSPRLRTPDGKDLVALRVEVEGSAAGTDKTVRFDLIDCYDHEYHVSAMERTTGYSLAITGLMQADGRVGKSGVFTPDECMPADAYIAELATRGVEIRRTER